MHLEILAILTLLGAAGWGINLLLGRRRQAAAARELARSAMAGTHVVGVKLLGSMGGSAFEPAAPLPLATLEPSGDHVESVSVDGRVNTPPAE